MSFRTLITVTLGESTDLIAEAPQVAVHCLLCTSLHCWCFHPLKFSRATPKQQDYAYLRLLHPETGVSPTPDELLTDRDRCWGPNILNIWKSWGTIVRENGNRPNGHMAIVEINGAMEWSAVEGLRIL